MSLLRTAARAHVATRVIGSTHRKQQQRWAAQDAQAAPSVAPPATPSTVAAPVDTSALLDQLAQLGQLRDAGVLTPEEFEAQKARLLSTS